MTKLFMIDIQGTQLTAEEQEILQHPNVGAVILFAANYTSPKQLKALTASICALRSDIFIAVDQEGGAVQRFQRHGFAVIPPASAYGEAYDKDPVVGVEQARQNGQKMANDLLVCGVDVSLAPVLDLARGCSVIQGLDRAFHRDPDAVTNLAEAFIDGMHNLLMPCVGKHVPGHGSVNADSHLTMPVSDADAEQLFATDFKPFETLISKRKLDALMPAHVTYRAVDPTNPAGFSEIWLQHILRQRLEFDGLIISDCLSMSGADIGDIQTRVRRALEAGCDLLIVSHQPRDVVSRMLREAPLREISDESVRRIDAFMRKMRRFASSPQSILTLTHARLFPDVEPREGSDGANLNRTLTV